MTPPGVGPTGRNRHEHDGWRLVEPARRPVLFVNPHSGGGAAARAGVIEQAHERGIEVVVLGHGQSLGALVDEAVAAGADALGMAGGDGSLAVVAAAAVAHDLPFVCIPAGTRNHFAMDLGVDRHDMIGSLDAFSQGVERPIDIAQVNGRLFLNNVSLGVYGDAVAQSAYRNAKTRTLVETAARVLGPSSLLAPDLRIVDDAGREHTQLALVLVSNNPYALDPLLPGTRPSLNSGLLGIVLLDAPGPPQPPGRAWTTPHIEVSASAPVHAGIDGEAVDLPPPMRFSILPAALSVRISSRDAGRRREPPLHLPSPGAARAKPPERPSRGS